MCWIESHSGYKVTVKYHPCNLPHDSPDEIVKPIVICHDSPCYVCESRKDKTEEVARNRFRAMITLEQFKKYRKVTIHGSDR